MIKKLLILGAINILSTSNALALQAEVDWLEKYPKPSPVTMYPWYPITLAENFVACSPPAGIPTGLRQVLIKMSRAHYLDDFSGTVKSLKSFSDSGNETAKFFLASILTEGTTGEIDDIASNNLIKEIESSTNLFILANLLDIKLQLAERLNLEDETLTTEFYSLLTDAFEKNPGNTFIAESLGSLYALDDDVPVNNDRAFDLLESSLKSCPANAWAKSILARFTLLQKDDAKSTERAKALRNSIASSVNVSTLYQQAREAYGDEDGNSSFPIALSLFEKAAAKGHAASAFYAGNMYLDGEGTPVDLDISAQYLKLAAHLGDEEALISYAEILRDGIGLPADPISSIEYFEAARQSSNSVWLEPPRIYELIGDEESLLKAKDIFLNALTQPNPDGKRSEKKTIAQANTGLRRVNKKLLSLKSISQKRAVDPEISTDDIVQDIEFGNFHALLIGNENYNNLDRLDSAIEDATDLSEVLANQYGFETELLIDASRSEILTKLNEYRFGLSERDNFLLFYAGHGIYDEQADEGFWQPIDATSTDENWITNDRITSTLRGFKSKNIMVVADSCYSGVVFRSGNSTADRQTKVILSSEYLRSMLEKRTRVAITSGGMEPVIDSLPGSRNSVFSGAFIKKLRNSDKILTAQELFLSVSEEVITSAAEMGLEQTPGYAGIRRSGHDGGDFLFVPKKK